MAVLSDQNLVKYKSYLDDLKTQVNSWTKYLSNAETALNSSVGNTFKTQYSKGKKAAANIQSIIDILQSLKKDLNTLVTDATAFYTTSLNASKK